MPSSFQEISGGVTAPEAFLAGSIFAGIKASNPSKPDIAFIHSSVAAVSAGTFTTNKVKAAPVRVSPTHIRSAETRTIVANSGNANACTGAVGIQDSKRTAKAVAKAFGVKERQVLVCSTGRIGVPLPIERMEAAIAQGECAGQRDEKGEEVDLGFVGEVTDVALDQVRKAIAEETVPVISPIGCDPSGAILNVNADTAAGAIAVALNASKIIYLSDVLGIMRDPRQNDSLIPTLQTSGARRLILEDIIEGGMIPKVESAIAAIEKGVKKVHLIDGRIPHSLLLEIFTNSGVGTEIVA